MAAVLTFDKNRCKSCELCIAVCPKGVLALDTQTNKKGYHPVTAKAPDDCIACASCAKICPDSVIFVGKT